MKVWRGNNIEDKLFKCTRFVPRIGIHIHLQIFFSIVICSIVVHGIKVYVPPGFKDIWRITGAFASLYGTFEQSDLNLDRVFSVERRRIKLVICQYPTRKTTFITHVDNSCFTTWSISLEGRLPDMSQGIVLLSLPSNLRLTLIF